MTGAIGFTTRLTGRGATFNKSVWEFLQALSWWNPVYTEGKPNQVKKKWRTSISVESSFSNEDTSKRPERCTESSTTSVAKSIKDIGSIVKSVFEVYKTQKSVKAEKDEDVIFGQMVATSLKRKKNKKQKKEIKKKIFLCLMEDPDNE
ncbi:hypothetical protein ABEB36_006390 [Hypothenemus hampei]|uniref:Uncharacterized protein n=1 Tax=Hypothenemus hampei TaxID=57062 RepID=A0ABD1EQD4_HYPHA